jgi:DnaJ-domain-containing protein 1
MLKLLILVFIFGIIIGAITPFNAIMTALTSTFRSNRRSTPKSEQNTSEESTFKSCSARLLGMLARIDGPITKQEEQAFNYYFFNTFTTTDDYEKKELLDGFRLGIMEGRNLTEKIANFYWQFSSKKEELRSLLNIAMHLIISDGAKNSNEAHVLDVLGRSFGVHPKEIFRMEEQVLSDYYAQKGYSSKSKVSSSGASSTGSSSRTGYTGNNYGTDSILQSYALTRHYRTLGCPPGANRQEVKKAYRQLVKDFHPDSSAKGRKDGGTRFREIQEAYETLRRAGRG